MPNGVTGGPDIKIWLDDIRTPPDETWTWCKNPEEFRKILDGEGAEIDEISFDHDLGYYESGKEITGYTCLCWVEKRILTDMTFPIPTMHVHTSNGSAYSKMRKVVNNLHKIRDEKL